MKSSIIYSSVTGNTKIIADVIYNSLDNCIYYGNPNDRALEADIIFVGFWTDKGSCNKEIAEFLQSIENKNIALFGTAGFGGNKKYFNQIIEIVSTYIPKSNQIVKSFMCQGKMPMSVKNRYESILKQNPNDEHIKGMIENFEKASSHPNNNDIEAVKNFVKSLVSD